MLAAQDKVAAAEARLWEVRERLLGPACVLSIPDLNAGPDVRRGFRRRSERLSREFVSHLAPKNATLRPELAKLRRRGCPDQGGLGGGEGDRTLYLLHAMQALYQLSYAPEGADSVPEA